MTLPTGPLPRDRAIARGPSGTKARTVRGAVASFVPSPTFTRYEPSGTVPAAASTALPVSCPELLIARELLANFPASQPPPSVAQSDGTGVAPTVQRLPDRATEVEGRAGVVGAIRVAGWPALPSAVTVPMEPPPAVTAQVVV